MRRFSRLENSDDIDVAEFGRKLANDDWPVEDIVEVHHQILRDMVSQEFGVDIESVSSVATQTMSELLKGLASPSRARERLDPGKQGTRNTANYGALQGPLGLDHENPDEVGAGLSVTLAMNRFSELLDSIDEGFVLFDSQGDLVVCNARYRAAYPLIEDMLSPGVNIEDVLRAAATRGALPAGLEELEQWVGQRLERHANSNAVIECLLGNGRCYRISERQTSDGGIVKVLMDITELRDREWELSEKSNLLGMTLENMSEGLTLMDENLDIVLTNKRAIELLDIPDEVFRPGVNAADIFRYNARRGEYGESDTDQMVADRVAQAKEFKSHFFQRTRPDGTVLEVRGNPIPDGGGFVTTYTDVTARVDAEKSLRRSEERYSLAMAGANDGLFDWDLEAGIVYRSPRIQEMLDLGEELQETEPGRWLTLIHDDDIDRYQAAMATHFKGESDFFECEYRVRCGDGSYRWVLDRALAQRNADGRVYRLVGSIRDVTQTKKVEAALTESEAWLNGIVENAPMVICMRDREGRIVKSNRASDELVESNLWPLTGKTLFEIFPKPLAEKLTENDRQVIETGVVLESDILVSTPEGEREFHDVKFPILDHDGEVSAVVVIGTDITERNRADRKLRRTRERLVEAVESMPNGFALFDSDERLILANTAYSKAWACASHLIAEGVTATEIARAVADDGGVKFPNDDADEWLRDRMERFRLCDGEHEHQMTDGRWVVAQERKTKIGETVSIRIDVTDLKRAEHDVLAMRDRLIDAIESIEEAFALFDKDDRLVLFNKAFQDIFHDMPHLVKPGIRFEDQIRASVAAGLIADAVGGEEEYITERMRVHREGGTMTLKRRGGHWIRISERRTKDGGYVGIRTDFSGIKETEDRLRVSEERFRIIAETAPLPVIITDKDDGTIRYASPRIVDLFGVTADKLLGRRASEFYDDPKERKQVLDELNRKGRVSGYELRARRDDGSTFWAAISIAPISYEGKDSLLTCSADISLQKENESILRDNEKRLRTIIDNVADGIAVINRSGEIITTNAALSLIFGYQSAELIGRPVTMLMPESIRLHHASYIDSFVNTGKAKIIGQAPREVPGLHKDGSDLTLELAVNTYSVGDQMFFVGALRDIGPRKQLEFQILQTQKMEALGTLAGGVAHDLNNTLVPILGLSELLLDDFPEASDERESMEHIHASAMRASRLVKQILAFSRQEEAEIQTLELSSALSHMLDMLRASIPPTVNIERDIEDGSIEVLADETQLHQVIMNLCVNAAQAIGDQAGTITVRLDRVEIDEMTKADHPNLSAGICARIRVGDDGQGIDDETLTRIFDPFFTTKAVGEGTGLGLSVVHGVIKRHGGEILVDSQIGKGTTFEIILPLKVGTPGDQKLEKD